MDGLRARLLDAGIELVAERGEAALRHNVVDASAQVPAGVTRGLFPTRHALVEAVAERCIDRELEMAGGSSPAGEPSAEMIAALFDRFADRALGEGRSVTLARHALQAEVARDPALRASYAVGAAQVDTWAVDLVRRAGSPHPERDFGIVANYVTGLVFHELALPTPDLDVAGRVRTLIDALGWSTP